MLAFPAERVREDEPRTTDETRRGDLCAVVALPIRPVQPRRSPWAAVVSMIVGGAVVLGAVALVLMPSDARVRDLGPFAAAPVPAGPLALSLSGPGDVTVLHQAYEPGKTSGWHAHSGIHAVAVLSGTLTIYDEDCQAHQFGPGESYVGGQENHLVRNETAVPVDMVVTYLNPGGPHDSTRHLAAPAGCAAGVAS